MSTIAGVILTMAVIAAGLIMVLGNQWRWAIAGLAIQYLVVFLLISQIWPIGLAAIKLVTGWITCVLLWMSGSPNEYIDNQHSSLSAQIFRGLSSVLILVIVFSATPIVNIWIPTTYYYLLIGLILMGLGLIQFGISDRSPQVIIGLLMLLSGFEVIYSTLEGSALLAAILALIHMALGLIGSYYHSQSFQEAGK